MIEEKLPGVVSQLIQQALAEDIGQGDLTTNSILPEAARMRGRILAKQDGILAGLDVARLVFLQLDPACSFNPKVAEGDKVSNRQTVADLEGRGRALLTGERTALNFLGRMSGIATLTHQYVEAVAGTGAVILDTRKTAPGLRVLDKLAVRRGGGQNHRFGLYDMILIKDNHIDFAGSLAEAVKRARAAASGVEIEVETRNIDEVRAALDLKVERILLDNMNLEMLAAAVRLAGRRARLEASGNVNLGNVRQIAETGVDYISIGALTHSAGVFDVSLDWLPHGEKE